MTAAKMTAVSAMAANSQIAAPPWVSDAEPVVTHPRELEERDQVRLVSFLRLLIALAVLFFGVEVCGAFALRSDILAMHAVVLAAAIASFGACLRIARRAAVERSATYMAGTIVAVAVAITPIATFAMSTMVLVPLLAAVSALPYVKGKRWGVLAAVSVAGEICVVVLGASVRHSTTMPSGLATSLSLSSSTAAAFLIFFLLWQYVQRERERFRAHVATSERAAGLMRATEQRVRLLIDSIPDYGVFMVDPMGTITSWTPAATALTGFAESQALGRTVSILYPSGAMEEALADLRRAETLGRVATEANRVRADGSTFWASWVIGAMRHEDRVLAGFSIVVRDLTEKKRAADERDFLSTASARLSESLDLDRTMAAAVELAVPRVADWCQVDLIGPDGELRPVVAARREPKSGSTAVSRQESGELFVAPLARRAFVRGESCLLDGVTSDALRALDAPAAAVGALLTKLDARSLVSVPIRGRERAVVGVISYAVSSDSARRFDAGELGVLEELSRRIALAMENAQLYAGARHAVESRDEFLSIASHELRTPLTSLVLQVQSLRRVVRRSGEAMPTEKVEPRLETIEKQVDRLTSLIEDLLDVSRAVSGKFALQYSEGDLKKVVKDVVNRFKDDAERAGCELTLTAERCEGTWDQLRFEQVLSNLITNGLKYGAGRPVEVQLMADDERAHVLVRDRGIGIAPADHARIFERFERAVSHQHFGGLGLGLWISKRIVEAMGGRISLRSASGEGAEFLVSLPRRPAAETQDESAVQG